MLERRRITLVCIHLSLVRMPAYMTMKQQLEPITLIIAAIPAMEHGFVNIDRAHIIHPRYICFHTPLTYLYLRFLLPLSLSLF